MTNANTLPERPSGPLTIAVSDCLTGAPVRYDGTDKRLGLCHDQLAGLFELRGICPEIGIGMGAPRDPIQLVAFPDGPRAIGVADPSVDVTDQLEGFGRQVAAQLDDVSGYIFTRNSPSCGLYSVKVHDRVGATPRAIGTGIYAAAIARALPDLPLEENGRLDDPLVRAHFVQRTFVYAHWRRVQAHDLSVAALKAFHSLYQEVVTEHSLDAHRSLGRLLANLSETEVAGAAADYFSGLMRALSSAATSG